ncbi:4-hydroxythreonine-4-phosphate dehydrogenase PdxA [Deferribacter autotrophicus]|uniref:4-hydroxythreonine-4-phosphate dehydrogenase PdxA n=1 Tax=Deferribacter autotrophicus TaxID=500465 RepID=A0A5A8F4Q0_9BACT|nr:4-hydroxythreonine-4-phosphate dehydrogenase PdxA [Deferribacter autotrophicus]KAA0259016.1 4-hydroxythreonine-4-phosphate dehydrogenase PdxA [Deferribacter autotrophicus]
MEKIKIAVTIGDPAGIGPEICCKLINEGIHLDGCEILFVGNKKILDETFKRVLQSHKLKDYKIVEPDEAVKFDAIEFGKIKKEYGRLSMLFVEKAVKMAMRGEVDAVVTCPINKRAIQLAGYKFPGHTEFLGFLTGSNDYSMMLVGDRVKVVLVTTHLPIKEVAKSIDKEKIKKAIINAHNAGRFFGKAIPKIAVCGLNPHAGDEGALGDEELKIIRPAVDEMERDGFDVSGPYPADSLFPKVLKGEFDFVVCMYHDQGLIPVKMESFGAAVNVTLNLPIIRTSVDHGTAFDIAGKNLANNFSLKKAIEVAVGMVKNVKSA